ncbi:MULTISPECIES: FadR/GntR family transcriptional regulator [Actinomadura]|uniref:FadR/GntR family transcriptional regulator n=1 Tax=Actinomadura yumaensis TaxID=111807 RepID=A0ABW2CNQ4_9ACTN|nr:FadR/GntR family transcriptional regulator [Actinomadura sp. J1-007]
MTVESPSRESVTNATIRQIKTMIATGEFPPGHRLPTERELAVRLGVSRNSLREAIRALTLVGMLESRQGDGTYVRALVPAVLLDAFSMMVELSQDTTVLDLLAVRRVLEAAAAAQAASRITEEQLAGLAASLEEMRRDPQRGDGRVDEVVDADMRFHSIIAEAAGNPVLSALIGSLNGRTLSARLWRGHLDRGVFERAGDEHEAIYNALRDRDPTRAAAVAAAHIDGVESFFRR